MDKKIIYTNVNWFTISDYPDENLIPDEIHQAKKYGIVMAARTQKNSAI
jgi:hypothetical protein